LTGNSGEARPGLAPGGRWPAGTMFAALYGELTPHPWRDPDSGRDAYILFHERSLAMGWLDDVATAVRKTAGGVEEREFGAAGLWSMNDAGRDHPLAGPAASLVAWFQVGVEPVPGDRPLPVQPFLRCAGDATARIGTLRLRAVQVLLPVQGLDTSSRPEPARMRSLFTVGWFGDCDPQARTPVRVTLDSGQDPSIPSAAPQMREWMSRLDQDVFVCESYSLADHDPLTMEPPFDDSFWTGASLPPGHLPRGARRVVTGCARLAGRLPRRPERPARGHHPAAAHRQPDVGGEPDLEVATVHQKTSHPAALNSQGQLSGETSPHQLPRPGQGTGHGQPRNVQMVRHQVGRRRHRSHFRQCRKPLSGHHDPRRP
jgi:hypothetical protein